MPHARECLFFPSSFFFSLSPFTLSLPVAVSPFVGIARSRCPLGCFNPLAWTCSSPARCLSLTGCSLSCELLIVPVAAFCCTKYCIICPSVLCLVLGRVLCIKICVRGLEPGHCLVALVAWLCPCRARELPSWLHRVSRVAVSIFVLPLLCDCDWLPLWTQRCVFASTLLYPVVSRSLSLYHSSPRCYCCPLSTFIVFVCFAHPFALLLLLPPSARGLGPGTYFNRSRQLFAAAPLTSSLHLNSPHIASHHITSPALFASVQSYCSALVHHHLFGVVTLPYLNRSSTYLLPT